MDLHVPEGPVRSHDENFTYTLEVVGEGAKSACDRALKKEVAAHA